MSLYLTDAGRRLFDQQFERYWVSVVVLNEHGIAVLESERFLNHNLNPEMSIGPVPDAGIYWLFGRLWETETSDEYILEVNFEVNMYQGSTAELQSGPPLWIRLRPESPPQRGSSASDSG